MSVIVILCLVGVLGFVCQWLAWKTKQPAILYLLIIGISAGPVTGLLKPDQLFGELLFPFVSLAVSIILFEGSLTLKRQELKEMGPVVWKLVTYGAIINAIVVTFAVRWLTELSWSLAALFGAMMVVTGPTVIMPLLRAVKPNVLLSRTLRWEGIIIDPLGAILAVLVFEWIVVQQTNADMTQVIMVFLQAILSGTVVGIAMAYPLGLLLRHHWIPEYLQNFAAISFVIAAFVISNSLTHESGLLAVTIMGIWLANMKDVNTRGILEFKESLTLIFVSVLFILLAARIDFDSLEQLGWGALGVLLVMQFIARPVKVFACTLGSRFKFNEKVLLAWVGPRGIVAAAVSALFALRLEQLGVAQAQLLVPLSFSVIVGTVVIQSLTSRPFAKFLKVSEPEATGYLIVGANPVAIFIGKALQDAGSKVLLCARYWDNVKSARMAGLPTYYGNLISDHADLHMDISGLGGMLGLSYQRERNVAAALRFREDFGIRKIFTLSSVEESKDHSKHRTSDQYKGRILFDDEVTYGKLASLITRKGRLKKTPISDTFTYENWQNQHDGSETVALFAVSPQGNITWFSTDQKPKLDAGWTIYSIVVDEALDGTGKTSTKNGT